MSIYHGISKVFYINSTVRCSGTSDTNFSYTLNIPSKNTFNKVCLLQLSIPKSFYNFPSGSNTFILQEKGVNYTITVPFGSYNVTNLCSTLSSILTAASGNSWTYSVSYPTSSQANTGLLTFTVSGNGIFQPSLIFTGGYCYIQLGFNNASTNAFVSSSLSSVNFICLSTVNRIYVKSSMCSTSEQSILQEVLQTFPDNSYIYFEQYDIQANSKEFTNNLSQVFDFVITDGEGKQISTNGLNVQMSLLCYEKNDTSELQKEDLIIKNLQRIYDIEEKTLELIKK
jgi:hypothetical protein